MIGIHAPPRAARAALLAAVALACVTGTTRPPPSSTPDADADAALRERLLADLAHVADVPRPAGSAALSSAAGWIEERLRAEGAEVEVQHTASTSTAKGVLRAGWVRNVVARFPASAPPAVASGSGAVVVVAHLDTVNGSPGACDDGAGLVSLIETARSVRAIPRRPRDVVLLATDGEENGLLGATAFLSKHPLARSIAAVINLDARGCSGPAFLFETRGAGVFEAYAAARVGPFGDRALEALYRSLPNDTDGSVFRDAGLRLANLALGAAHQYYHSPLDRIENVDASAVAHLARSASELTRAFLDEADSGSAAHTGDSAPRADDRTTHATASLPFPVAFWPLPFFALPGWTPWVVFAALLASCAALAARAIHRVPEGVPWGGIARRRALSSAKGLVAPAVAIACAYALSRAFALEDPVSGLRDVRESRWGAILLFSLVPLFLLRPREDDARASDPAAILRAVVVGFALAAPIAAPEFALYAGLPALAILALVALERPWFALALEVVAVVAFARTVALASLIGPGEPFPAALAGIVAVTCFLGRTRERGVERWTPAALCALAGAGLWFVLARADGRPLASGRTSELFYCADLDAGRAWWGTFDEFPDDPRNARYLGEAAQWMVLPACSTGLGTARFAAAPSVLLAPSSVVPEPCPERDGSGTCGASAFTFRLVPRGDPGKLHFKISANADIAAISIDGVPFRGNAFGRSAILSVYAPSPSGTVLSFRTAARAKGEVRVIESWPGWGKLGAEAPQAPESFVYESTFGASVKASRLFRFGSD